MTFLTRHADSVPVYKLYGERQQWPMPDLFHCELIADRSQPHNWQIKLHQHHSLVQFLYLKGGTARVSLDGSTIDLAAGHIVQVPAMCVHGFRFHPGAQGHVLTLASSLAKRLAQVLDPACALLGQSHIYPIRQSARNVQQHGQEECHTDGSMAGRQEGDAAELLIEMAFSQIQLEYQTNSPHRTVLIETLLTGILVWLSRHQPHLSAEAVPENDRGRQHFHRFTELIEAHYAEQWTIEAYAGRLGITAAYLNSLCRQIIGHSALDLVHQRLILAAKRNLIYTSMTISVISYSLGFNDPAYFARFFKRETGLSPRQFRRDAVSLLAD